MWCVDVKVMTRKDDIIITHCNIVWSGALVKMMSPFVKLTTSIHDLVKLTSSLQDLVKLTTPLHDLVTMM